MRAPHPAFGHLLPRHAGEKALRSNAGRACSLPTFVLLVLLLAACASAPSPPERTLGAGFRYSAYGPAFDPGPEYWALVGFDMARRFDRAVPETIWIVSRMHGSGTRLNFPVTAKDPLITGSPVDENERTLDLFDRLGVRVWLQIEPGFASVDELIDAILERYKHHSSVIGFGIDVEWYRSTSPDEGQAVTDEEATRWLAAIRRHNANYRLFLKHWLPEKMPPTVREGLMFVDDSQILPSMEALVDEFAAWGRAFAPAPVGFQFGYPSDRPWWSELADPPGEIGRAILDRVPNAQGLYWVDFTVLERFPPVAEEPVTKLPETLPKYEGLALTPPMGWNSWNRFGCDVDEKLIRETADAIVSSGMKDAGYQYVNVDDCWHGERDARGFIQPDPKRFPSGMKALADYIHSKGLKFGIYSDAGWKTCGGRPGGRGYEHQDAMTYAEWGVDYLKYDWCNTEGLAAEGAYLTMSQALRDAGRPIVLSICEWGENQPWRWGRNIGHLWRTTGDITNCFDCVVDHGTWKSWGVMQILDRQRWLRRFAGPDGWNDPDMLEVGNGMSAAEDRAHFSMWAMLAAPLIAGNDVRNMSEETRSILTNRDVIAVNQDPLGVQAFRHRTLAGAVEIWAKPLAEGDWAICLLNRSTSPQSIELDWTKPAIVDELSMRKLEGRYAIRNLWTKANLGDTNKPLVAEIPPHDVLMMRLEWPIDRAAVAARVRDEMRFAWRAYEQYAWGHDELRPVSKTLHDWYGQSLMMTPVDSLDTLLLMGLSEEAERARALIVEKLSFDRDVSVQHFEVTIRLLGGLLSGYQMTGDERLLRLADDLGARLLPAFDSPTGMPYRFVNLRTGKTNGAESNPAEIGTLILEFGTLAKLTAKPVYYDKAKKALVEVYKRRSPIGLVGERIDVETGKWTNRSSHVGARIDSYYEYLLKCAKLFDDADCATMWRESIAAVNEYLADELPSGLWYGVADMDSGNRTASHFGALHAFFPGVLALGGDANRAARLQESSFAMWNLHGIEPEVIDYGTMNVVHAGYPLRPEIIESAWYLHHLTKDPRYLDMGRTFFESLVAHCRTDAGYTNLKSVVTKEKGDLMPSYFLTETLKYLYLLFAPEGTLDPDQVVFNTEAHPFRRTW